MAVHVVRPWRQVTVQVQDADVLEVVKRPQGPVLP